MAQQAKKQDIGGQVEQVLKGRQAQSLVIGNLLEKLMAEWGGPDKFARSYYRTYCRAAKGGVARQRMLDGILRLFTHHTANLKGRGEDFSSLSDQDLERVARMMLEREHEPPAGPPPF